MVDYNFDKIPLWNGEPSSFDTLTDEINGHIPATRVVVFAGKSKMETISDITGEKGYAVGFKGLVNYVMSQLPQNEVIEGAIRKEVKLVPKVVVRELLANALIHQDMDMGGASPSVEVYSNRVEISNPGEPIVPVERFIDGYQSRNERLADLMRRSKICEEKGSGIDKVISAIETFQLPPPDIRAGSVRTSVILFAYKNLKEMDKSDKLRACYQHCVLRYILGQKMTNQSLRGRFGLSNRQTDLASRIIAAALEEGVIKLEDPENTSKRYAKYIPYWA